MTRWLAQHVRRTPKENDPTHIAVLCDWFLRYGSAQAIGLRDTGIRVTLYYVDRLGEFGGRFEDREVFLQRASDAGVDLVRLPMRSPLRLLAHVRWLLHDLRSRKVTAIVAQAHYDPRYALVSLRIPTAVILHDPKPHTGEETTLPIPGRVMARFVEATATCIVVHSDRLRSQIRPFLRHQRVAVAPHGADIAGTPLLSPPSKELLILGRLFPYKGIDVAVDALGRVRRTRGDVQLTVAGRGPSAEALRRDLPTGVRLVDRYVSDEEVDALLAQATLMLIPYRDATQSGVGLLAIGRGVPCIVASEGGLPDLVPGSLESCVVPAGDPVALAAAILRHLDHGDDLRRTFHDHAARNFAWPIAGRILISELLRLRLVRHDAADTATVRTKS